MLREGSQRDQDHDDPDGEQAFHGTLAFGCYRSGVTSPGVWYGYYQRRHASRRP